LVWFGVEWNNFKLFFLRFFVIKGKMSGWKAYVNEMVKNGSCSQAAVCGAYDGTIWAKTKGFNLYEYEVWQQSLEGEDKALWVSEPEL
jgi:hypothetical protein